MAQNYSIESSLGGEISITTYGNENISSVPCIILVSGYQGFKDWGYSHYFADYFVGHGFFVITYNSSHNGIGKNKYEITETEKFADNTLSREVLELKDIVNAYEKNSFGKITTPRIGMVGHSRGGAISILGAWNSTSVKAVTTWGSISTFDRYSERQKDFWRKTGFFPTIDAHTKRKLKHNLIALEDYEKHKDGLLNLEKAVSKLKKPLLIIHGKDDMIVKTKEAETLYGWADKKTTRILIVDGTGHTFGCVHPFKGSNEKFDFILKTTLDFFDKYLK